MPQSAARLLATWFGCGYAPAAPGTAGSAAAIVIGIALEIWFDWPPWAFGALAAFLVVPGIWSAAIVARQAGSKDPQQVVIDEVIGQWITVAAAATLSWKAWLAAFVLFRLFDIWKPPPVRQLERLPGGFGIVADDVMAGVYGAIVIFIAGRLHFY
jgi:phosphatidylglycerophosphatase A